MTDRVSKSQRSYNMSQVKCRDTGLEIKLRKELHKRGLKGYRTQSNLFGKPDIIFTKYKIAIFVDGCFWHKCPICFKKPLTETDFWDKKIENNVLRDVAVNKKLINDGWKVLRFWEHEINKDINNVIDMIIKRRLGKTD
jgi:DNA mismatch endonuclease (patch repair protein)